MGFIELIRDIPTNVKVLDVGAWGLTGENTTTELVAHFEDVLTINIKKLDGVKVVADFYKTYFDEKLDLIVLDLNIDNNVSQDWTRKGLDRVHDLLAPDGFLIIYILTKEGYTEEEPTKSMINDNLKNFWKSCPVTVDAIGNKLREFKDICNLVAIQPCDRRDNIAWVKLQRV